MKQHFSRFTILLCFLLIGTNYLQAQHKGANPLTDNNLEETLQKRNQIAIKALASLSDNERGAVLSFISDVNEAASVTKKTNRKGRSSHADLKAAIRELRNHPKFQSIKWQAADGSTFDSRGEYLEYQWGVPYPSDINPLNPFE